MAFSDAAEVRKYLGGIFETAFADPEIGPQLRENAIVLKTVYTNPDAVVLIDTAAGTVTDGDVASEATAGLSMTADTGNAYWQGKVNLAFAMAKKQIKVEGNVAGLLKLAPVSKKLFPQYIATLKAAGRDDLLV